MTSGPTFCSAPWNSLNIDQTCRVSSCMHLRKEIEKTTQFQQLWPELTEKLLHAT